MKFNYLKKYLLVFGILMTTVTYSQDFTKEELDELRNNNLLTQEHYEILLSELGLGDYSDSYLYTFKVDGTTINRDYKIRSLKNKLYFPIFSFLKSLEITNYKYLNENETLLVHLGENLTELKIDFKNKIITYDGNKISKTFEEELLKENNEIYIIKDLMEKVFFEKLILDEKNLIINSNLNFNPPKSIKVLLEKTQRELEKSLNENEIIYENKGKLFELGNARVELDYVHKKEENKIDNDIEGRLSYQGSLLYGDFYTNYITHENKIGNTYLRYSDNIIENHELEIGNYYLGETNPGREFGFSLRKNKGYFDDGKSYIIEANVPIGSKVELIYYGSPIDLKNEENGKVVFDNPLIQGDKTYYLKIYSPDGKIEMRKIITTKTYNQQNKGEIEYDISVREHHESGDIRSSNNIYYGLTNNLTLGVGYDRNIVNNNENWEAEETGTLQLVYSNFLMDKYGYVFDLKTERGLSSKDKEKFINYGTFQIDIDKYRMILEGNEYGKYYEIENRYRLSNEYRVTDNLKLAYDIEREESRDGKNKNISSGSINYDLKYKELLISSQLKESEDKENREINVDFYYTGLLNNTITLENSWSGRDLDYSAMLNLYSSEMFGILDYNFGVGYSEREKEKLTLSFTLRYNNFFELSSMFGDRGSREIRAGIDTIIDLRNVKQLKTISSLDSSNLKVIAFVDNNNNDIYDIGEETVENVSIGIGKETIETDKNGVAYFSGIPNSILLELKPTVRKPSFTFGDNKIKVKGKGTSTIEAYIPIKPMMTLSGIIEIDKNLNLKEEDKVQLYNDLVIHILDKTGKTIELTIPDETGVFTVSGLFTEEYKVEIEYVGTKYNLPKLEEKVLLVYDKNESKQEVIFELKENKFVLNK